jgi:DNA topoisomerase I
VARKTAKAAATPPSPEAKKPAKPRKAAAPKAAAPKKVAAKKTAPHPSGETFEENGQGRVLVIVESPKKAKSINKFLGSRFVVKASMGHVRDLPEKGRDLGIDVAGGYRATYVVPDKKKGTISDLKKEASKADMVYLATDPDREGEAIAWHLKEALGISDDRARRVLFYEITERAVREAFQHVGPIDMDKVNAQQARRFLDRFVGYQLSPLLWKKVARGLSAGRVQSVAVRLIAEREKEIRAFVSEEYWKITADVAPAGSKADGDRIQAELAEWKGEKFSAKAEPEARAIRDALAASAFRVSALEVVEKLDKPGAPFKTSTLQQQASVRLGFSGKKTMAIAQELYEGIDVDGSGPVGLITYMRTDSLRVSDESVNSVRELIHKQFGDPYLPAKPNLYAAGKLAQEAHEAIRPTDIALSPERVKGRLTHDQARLYALIYRQFVGSQMTPARFEVTNVAISAGEGLFKTQGKILRFDGYRRMNPPGGKQEDALLPPLTVEQALDLHQLTPTQHFTEPPSRYREASLIKALEKENIGRPSTYAPIIQTIQDRQYVEQKERRFFCTDLGMAVTDVLVLHFPKIMDLKFTALMEDELDDIVTGKEEMVKVLDEFYHPFQEALKLAEKQMERVRITSTETCHKCGAPMLVKFSKNGQFLGCSKYPECDATRPMEGGPRAEAVETEHVCAKCGKPLMLREGSRGKFLSCAGYPACKETYNLDAEGSPVPSVVETEHVCPKCGKPMALRQGARGAFLGCTGYPKCRSTMPVDDQGRPIVPVKVDVKCEKCGGDMGVKPGRRGPFLGCLNYPKCRGTAPIPDDLKDKLGEIPAPAAAPAGADLKSIAVEETCDQCTGAMVVRRGRRGFFLGCANYPKCKGTKEPGVTTLEKIMAVTGA